MTKERGKELSRLLSGVHQARLKIILNKLQDLPGTESSLSAIEVCFYELLTTMKDYTALDGYNPFLDTLNAIRDKEYARCKDRFVSLSNRNKSVSLFKNRLQQDISRWVES
jgi:hypothetical protein